MELLALPRNLVRRYFSLKPEACPTSAGRLLLRSCWSSLFSFWPSFYEATTSVSARCINPPPPPRVPYSLPRPPSGTEDEDYRLSQCHIGCNHTALIQLACDSEGKEQWIDRELRREEKEQWIPLPLSNTILSWVISITVIPTPAVKCAIYFPSVICRQI